MRKGWALEGVNGEDKNTLHLWLEVHLLKASPQNKDNDQVYMLPQGVG